MLLCAAPQHLLTPVDTLTAELSSSTLAATSSHVMSKENHSGTVVGPSVSPTSDVSTGDEITPGTELRMCMYVHL